jgi:hypothetical protein
MACLLLEISAAGLLVTCTATCSEARLLQGTTGPADTETTQGPGKGWLDSTQGTEPLMRLSQPAGGGGSLESTAAAAHLQR